MIDGMSEICIDCVHQEVCRYECYCPSGHCNDRAVADDFIPQGEWITVNFAPNELNCPEKSRFNFVKCPFCEVIHQGRHNFCSYCGADMRGKNETRK